MDATLIVQICAICCDLFGIIAGFVRIITATINFIAIVRGIYTIVLAVFLLLGELYIFKFFRYFGFFFKNWGKALAYLFMGAALYSGKGFGLFCAIIFWAVAVAYFILGFFFKKVSYPFFQGGCCGKPPPSMQLDSTEIYEANEKQMEAGGGGGGNNNNASSPPAEANNPNMDI